MHLLNEPLSLCIKYTVILFSFFVARVLNAFGWLLSQFITSLVGVVSYIKYVLFITSST